MDEERVQVVVQFAELHVLLVVAVDVLLLRVRGVFGALAGTVGASLFRGRFGRLLIIFGVIY